MGGFIVCEHSPHFTHAPPPHSFLLPLIEADSDVGRFEALLRDSLQALYHSRCALLGTAATNQAQEAEIRLDAERVC